MIDSDMAQVTHRLAWGTRMCLEIIFTLIFTVAFAVNINVRLTIASFVCLPLSVWTSSTLGQMIYQAWKDVSIGNKGLNKLLNEGIANIRTVKQFYCENFESKEYLKALEDKRENAFVAHTVSCRMWGMFMLFCNLCTGIVLYFGSQMVANETVSVGKLAAFMSYNDLLAWMFNLTGQEYSSCMRVFGQAFKAFQVLERTCKAPFANKHNPTEIVGHLEL